MNDSLFGDRNGIQPYKIRVATNLEKPGNQEYSGNSLNLENSWNSQGFLCNLRDIFKQIK